MARDIHSNKKSDKQLTDADFQKKFREFEDTAVKVAGSTSMEELDWQIFKSAVLLSSLLDIREARFRSGEPFLNTDYTGTSADETDFTRQFIYPFSLQSLQMKLDKELFRKINDNLREKQFGIITPQNTMLTHLPDNLQNFAKEVANCHTGNAGENCILGMSFIEISQQERR